MATELAFSEQVLQPLLGYLSFSHYAVMKQIAIPANIAHTLGSPTCSSLRGHLLCTVNLQLEELPQLLHGIVGVIHRVADCPLVLKNFPIISSFESFVSEEMYGCVVDTTNRLFALNVSQTVGLIPASGKDVE